jgi:SAM-dependent methyltransferase
MGLFKNPEDSHEHSLGVLNLLNEYDSFLDNLSVVADMGCGAGLDALWWLNLQTRDDPPEPRNYVVYAVDQNLKQFNYGDTASKNLVTIEGDFEERVIPRKVDLIWSHDSFQYARNPFKCLATWKETLQENGMLVLSIPQTVYKDELRGRYNIDSHNHQYYNYNLLNLIYMLAMSGFDCKDAYFYRQPNSPWLYAAVYASGHDPITSHASWHDLIARNLINESIVQSINKYGHVRLEEVVVAWLDKNYHRIDN